MVTLASQAAVGSGAEGGGGSPYGALARRWRAAQGALARGGSWELVSFEGELKELITDESAAYAASKTYTKMPYPWGAKANVEINHGGCLKHGLPPHVDAPASALVAYFPAAPTGKALAAFKADLTRLRGPLGGKDLEVVAIVDGRGPGLKSLAAELEEPNDFVLGLDGEGVLRGLNRGIRLTLAPVVVAWVVKEEPTFGEGAEAALEQAIGAVKAGGAAVVSPGTQMECHGSGGAGGRGSLGTFLPGTLLVLDRLKFLASGQFAPLMRCATPTERALAGEELTFGASELARRMLALGHKVAKKCRLLSAMPSAHDNKLAVSRTQVYVDQVDASLRKLEADPAWGEALFDDAAGVWVPMGSRPEAAAKLRSLRAGCSLPAPPAISYMVQYYHRPSLIKRISARLHGMDPGLKGGRSEVIINNDSRDPPETFSLAGPSDIVLWAGNLHEIRGYLRMSLVAEGGVLVQLQDDDLPPDGMHEGEISQTPARALALFDAYPQLGLLTAMQAQVVLHNQAPGNDCAAYTSPAMQGLCAKLKATSTPVHVGPNLRGTWESKIPFNDPKTGAKFVFVENSVLGPYWMRKSAHFEAGQLMPMMSCPGAPGIGYDIEVVDRLYHFGWVVGAFEGLMYHREESLGGTKRKTKPGKPSDVLSSRDLRGLNFKVNMHMAHAMYRSKDFLQRKHSMLFRAFEDAKLTVHPELVGVTFNIRRDRHGHLKLEEVKPGKKPGKTGRRLAQ